MIIEPTAAVSSLGFLDIQGGEAASGFSARLKDEIGSVNSSLIGAEQSLRDLATGDVQNIHHVMLSLEEARLSFQLLVQVRNKALEAYQELFRMQI